MKQRNTLLAVLASAVLAISACSSAPTTSGASGTSTAGATSAAASGTGSGKTSDPIAWTGAFCEGVSPTLEGLVEVLKVVLQQSQDPVAQKAALTTFATTSSESMTATAKKLGELGPPSKEAEALHTQLVTFFTDNGKARAKAKEDLAKLDPNAPDFTEQVGKLGDSADQTALQEQITKLSQDPALKEAFAKAPQCVEMSNKMKALGTGLLGG